MTERVVLAPSGGPHTSVAFGWIAQETGAEVIAGDESAGEDCGERELARYERQIEQPRGEPGCDGPGFSPLKRALDGFVDEVSRHVTGDSRMTPYCGRAGVTGRRAEWSPYDVGLATYDTGDTFDQAAAKGFTDIYSLSSKIAARRALA